MNYMPTSIIGTGHDSIVYSAYRDGIEYAVKRVPIKYIISEMITMIFSDSISGTSILRPHGYIIDDDYFYTIMNREDGNLKSLIARDDIDENTVFVIMEQIMTALDYLHQNEITHNLLNESTILISDIDVKISDFNLAGYMYSPNKDLEDTGLLMQKFYREGFSQDYIDIVNALLSHIPASTILKMRWFREHIYRRPDVIPVVHVDAYDPNPVLSYSKKLWKYATSNDPSILTSPDRDRYLQIINIISNALIANRYLPTILTNERDILIAANLFDALKYTLFIR